MLRNTNYNELSIQQLEALETVFDTYLFKQPEVGEPWHPNYKKNKKSFNLLISQAVRLERTVKKSFADLKLKVPGLVNDVLADETKRINKWINENFNTDADISLANNLSDDIFPIYTNGADALATETGISTAVSHTAAPSQKFLTNYTLKLAKDLNQTTSNNIKQALNTSLSLGETRKEMVSRINDVIDDPARATMIAQTESVRAFTQGRIQAGVAMGYDQKEWVNGQPGACQICQDLDGQIVPIDEQFDTGSDSLGLVDGPPAHPNCRCSPPKLSMSDEKVSGSEIKGGWITKNGAHIYIDDNSADGKGIVVPQKSIGDLQIEHERALGLGQLSDFNAAVNRGDAKEVQRLGQKIQNESSSSPLAEYKTAVASMMDRFQVNQAEPDDKVGLGATAFDFSQYGGTQSENNAAVGKSFDDMFPAAAGTTNDFNWSIQTLGVGSLSLDVAADADRVAQYMSDMKNGAKFPPLMVVKLDGQPELLDGAHRYEALTRLGAKQINALVGTPK